MQWFIGFLFKVSNSINLLDNLRRMAIFAQKSIFEKVPICDQSSGQVFHPRSSPSLQGERESHYHNLVSGYIWKVEKDDDVCNIGDVLPYNACDPESPEGYEEEDVLEEMNEIANSMKGNEVTEGLVPLKNKKEVVNFIREEKLQVYVVLESNLKSKRIGKVCDRIYGRWNWLTNMRYCNKRCRIMVGWNEDEVRIYVIHMARHSVLVKMESRNNIKLYGTFIYASNGGIERKELWKDLEIYKRIIGKEPWFLREDMNVTLALNEHSVGGRISKEINSTLIALVPKIQTPQRVLDFTPIACYNVIYKCISKILTERINGCLDKLVSKNQRAFIPNRHIQDNIMFAQEISKGKYIVLAVCQIVHWASGLSFLIAVFEKNFLKAFGKQTSDTRPPMLDRMDFASWQQRIRLYCRGKENGVNILKSIDEGPFQMEMFRETLAEGEEGLELTKEDHESQLYDDFEHFHQHKGETIHDYYVQFAKLINDMRNIKMTMSIMQLNFKFVNNMFPEWGRSVTAVKLNRGLRDSNYDQLYAYLKQYEAHANENKMMLDRFTQNTIDPLALMSNVSHQVDRIEVRGIMHGVQVQVQLVIRELIAELGMKIQVKQDKMLLMQAQENDVALDEEQLLFITGPYCTDYVYGKSIIYGPVYDKAGPSYDSDILFEVHDHDHDQDAACEHNEVHEMHDDIQPNNVANSHADYMSDSNMIMYDQIVITDHNIKEENLKKELHSVKMQLSSTINHNKSMVEEVTSMKKDFKQKESKYLEEFLDMKALKEKFEDKLYKQDQSLQIVHMLCKPKSYYDEQNKVAIGYKNLLYITRARQVQPALSNGHEIIKTNHVPAIVHNSEETLEIVEITRKKINDKIKNSECVKKKVKITPHDYSKENYLATFTPQKQLTPEQIFWSKELLKMKEEALKEQTIASRPIKALMVYPPNTPATLVPRVEHLNLQLKYQHLKESFENKNPVKSSNAPTFDSVFIIGQLQDQIQIRGNTIHELREKISQLTKKHSDAVPIYDLKALDSQNKELHTKVNALHDLNERWNNQEVHLDYLKHLKESVATLHEIVKEARVEKPLDSSLAYAYIYIKHSQELVEYVIGTFPKDFNKEDNQIASTPVTKKKRLTFMDPCETSTNNTLTYVKQQPMHQTNEHAIPSTRVKGATTTSESKPRSNTKKNKTLPAQSDMKKVKVHPRNNKSSVKQKNRVDFSISYQRTVINSNSNSLCKSCNKCLMFVNHDKCVVQSVKSVKKTLVKKVWQIKQIVLWYLDSGCLKHMTGDRSRLKNFMKKFIGTVRFENDHFGAIIGYGDYMIGVSVISKDNADISKAPMFLWAKVVATACYAQNRSLIHTHHNKTPYELVYDNKPNLTFFRVFGALCYPTNDSKDLGKLQPTSDIGIFVGYAPSRKGESTIIEDNPFVPVDNDPFVNVFAPEPRFEASSSGDVSLAALTYVTQTHYHLGK
nr:RNA-directed DNA polymerase, eukaryota, reverse transcriptase zinc-binding domain protein [Tanacetum cinerariifolium]